MRLTITSKWSDTQDNINEHNRPNARTHRTYDATKAKAYEYRPYDWCKLSDLMKELLARVSNRKSRKKSDFTAENNV